MSENLELEWLRQRKRGVGSSDSPPLILGKVFGRTPMHVYLDKITDEVETDPLNPNFRRGHTYEPLALDIYATTTGAEIVRPANDVERYSDFQCWIPGEHVFADFDGIQSDGWVLEAKSPRQMVFDKIVVEGLKDYYQVQAHHLAGVANKVTLPHIGDKFKGKIKGTRVIVYSPDDVRVITHDIPYDAEMSDTVLTRANAFFEHNVQGRLSPYESPDPIHFVKKGGIYEPVFGVEWDTLAHDYIVNKQMSALAAKELDQVRDRVKKLLEGGEFDKVVTPSGIKFSYAEQAGRKRFNMDAFKCAYPDIDIDEFYEQGDPSRVFRQYGKAESGLELDTGEGTIFEKLVYQLEGALARRADGGEEESEATALAKVAAGYLSRFDADASRLHALIKELDNLS